MATNLFATFYCACSLCTDGDGITASGNPPREHYTIAAPRRYPLGTYLRLVFADGRHEIYVVDDRLGRQCRHEGHFDIYVHSHKDALRRGVQKLRRVEVLTINPNNNKFGK